MTPEEIRRLQDLQKLNELRKIEEIRKLTELQRIIRLVEDLRRLNEAIRQIREAKQRQEYIEEWAREHQVDFSFFSPEALEEVREKAEYDPEEWQIILRQLRKNQ